MMQEQPQGSQKDRAILWILVSLFLILAGDIGASLVKTDGGKVEVVGFKLPAENGQWIAADLFKPKMATEETPVPLVVVCPGFERSKESMDSYSIELARRGIAVVAIDPYSQGASSSTHEKRSASKEGYGVVPIVEYIYDTPNFNYVDKSRIGAAGYSAGGNAVLQSASLFGAREAKALKRAQARDDKDGRSLTEAELARIHAENKLSSVFVGGYVLTMSSDVLATVDANVGMDYARYDEGAFRTEHGNADMRDAPEALRLVNSALPDPDNQPAVAQVDIGKIYGDATNRTLRVVNNTKCIHPLMPFDTTHVQNMLNFFLTVFNLSPSIPSSNQIWPWKEFFTLTSLLGAFLFLVPFTRLMLRLPVFNQLVHPVPPALPARKTPGKVLFWTTFFVSAMVACYLFIPAAQVTTYLFPRASAGEETWWFPERINNAILLWALANAVFGLIVFTLTYQLFGKKHGVTPNMWGIKTTAKELVTSLGLALIVFVAFYGLLFASYTLFHTDFRFVFDSAPASFPSKMFLVSLEYIPLFFIFFLMNSIRVNAASRFEGQNERLNLLINAFANSLGLMLILTIQYIWFAFRPTVFWTQGWLYVNLLFGVVPLMFVLPIFNRYFFRQTGRVYLGPMITCPIFIMMMLTSNVCYLPV
jgi:hypothetical protein